MQQFEVVVHPRSRKTKVTIVADVLHLWVTAPPVDGAANDAVITLLSQTLRVARSQITIVRGTTARHKRVAIDGLNVHDVHERIGLLKA